MGRRLERLGTKLVSIHLVLLYAFTRHCCDIQQQHAFLVLCDLQGAGSTRWKKEDSEYTKYKVS